MFITECHMLFKHKRIMILYGIYLTGCIIWGIWNIIFQDYLVLYILLRTLEISRFSFIFFMILSFMYTSKNHWEGINEIVGSSAIGSFKADMSKIMVLQLLNMIITFFFIGMNILLTINMSEFGIVYLLYICKLWILYHGLPCFLACLVGLCISMIKKKAVGLTAMIFVLYIFTGNFVTFLQMMSFKTEAIYRFADLFCIFARGTRRSPNFYYLIPAEANVFVRIFLWCLLFFIIILYLQVRKNKKQYTVIFSSLLICMTIIYLQPFGAPYNDFLSNYDEWMADQTYYRNKELKSEEALFEVKDYIMDISINRQLQASITMQIDRKDLDYYLFTLYHGYKIHDIKDAHGNELEYERDGDYLKIWNIQGKLSQISVTYSGYSKLLYSTSQGVYLPGYFAYYPIPGYHPVYDSEKADYIPIANRPLAHFLINLHVSEPVFCALPEIRKNVYEGEAEGVTLIGSIFAKKIEVDGCQVVYSSLELRDEDIRARVQRLKEINIDKLNDLTIFIMPFSMHNDFYSPNGQLHGHEFTLEEEYHNYLVVLGEEQERLHDYN